MKWLLAIVSVLLVTSGCASSAGATQLAKTEMVVNQTTIEASSVVEVLSGKSTVTPTLMAQEANRRQTLIEKQQALVVTKLNNKKNIDAVIKRLKSRVGKTWYVFSGSTPQGWDCSGMVMWAYGKLGVNLEHRASKQKHAGTRHKTPKIGDIVAFSYGKSWGAYHVGIYVGKGLMIHSGGGRGQTTGIMSIKKFGGNYSTITYVRILDTP